MAGNLIDTGIEEILNPELDYHALNTQLNLYDENGRIQFEAGRKAARQYFLQHVNQNTVFFHDLEEELDYLVREGCCEAGILTQYDFADIKALSKHTHAHEFRFSTFLGAFKCYISYTLKTFDGKRYLERFEDRVSMVALYLARGDFGFAQSLVDEMMAGRFQPATPTFLNAGKRARGELVSCFLSHVEDNMESITRGVNSALQLSKRGSGMAPPLTNLREAEVPIEKIQNQSSDVVPIMKLLEGSFSYTNRLGARQGADTVYLHVHHPDILSFLDTKRENTDEKTRIKTLSLSVIIPDITFQLAKDSEDMCLFSPYNVERVYRMPFSEISMTKRYREMVGDGHIHKKKINARHFFRTPAEIQFESGYPYIIFEDTVNKASLIKDRITVSSLRSGILQVSEASTYNDDLSFSHVGKDISCNLGFLNIARAMDSPDFSKTTETTIWGLTAVSDLSNIRSAPSIARGNAMSRAVGLRATNLHGYLTREHVMYGSEEALDFMNTYFFSVAYETIKTSYLVAKEHGETFEGSADSKCTSGEHFEKCINGDWTPRTETCEAFLAKSTIHIPAPED